MATGRRFFGKKVNGGADSARPARFAKPAKKFRRRIKSKIFSAAFE
jgi:hypothetical protein